MSNIYRGNNPLYRTIIMVSLISDYPVMEELENYDQNGIISRFDNIPFWS